MDLEGKPRKVPRGFLEQRNELGPKLVLVLCGLPARGKSYIAKKLCRYISWLGLNCKIFNVGNRRRTHAASSFSPEFAPVVESDDFKPNSQRNFHDAQFFDGSNETARKLRDQLALDTLEELIDWLSHGGGKVAMHDATNSTVARRKLILDRCSQVENLHVIFIESICTDPSVIEANIQMKLQGPDYANLDPGLARLDFLNRMKLYEKAYEIIGDEEEKRNISYIKIINVGSKVIAFNIKGYLGSQCVFYLMNIHIKNRLIWLTRHGESEYNLDSRIGGDPSLTAKGTKYANALTKLLQKWYPPDPDFGNLANFSLSPVSSVENLHDPLFHNPNASTPDVHPNNVSRPPSPLHLVPSAVGDIDASSTNSCSLKFGASNGGALTSFPPLPDFAADEKPSQRESETLSRLAVETRRSGSNDLSLSSSRPPKLSKAEHLIVYTSLLKRTMETAVGFPSDQYEVVHMRSLNEIYAGVCENMTYEEIKANYPKEFAARALDKLNYRYPGPSGESYLDVIERLRPTIVEIERLQSPCLIVTHRVVLRTLLAYFCGLPLTEMTRLKVPLHALYQLRPRPYGTDVVLFQYNEETNEFDQFPFVPQAVDDE